MEQLKIDARTSERLEAAKKVAVSIMDRSELKYHNTGHMLQVYDMAERLCDLECVWFREKELVLVAAAFHDVGRTVQERGHERIGALMAEKELRGLGFREREMGIVKELIMDTRLPPKPRTELGRILCDADLSAMGAPKDAFLKVSQDLMEEHGFHSMAKWNQHQIAFLSGHPYFTVSASLLFDGNRRANIRELERQISELKGLSRPR